MKKEIILLYRGSEKMPYCAFPTLAETDEGILCAFKQGTAHSHDQGITPYFVMQKDGTILRWGDPITLENECTQNAELLTLSDGRIYCYVDAQNISVYPIERTGTLTYVYEDGQFTRIPGIFTDTAGKVYGYNFDSVVWNGKDYMLAMTFPELDYPEAEKRVNLLVSADQGKTWEDKVYLDSLTGLHLNESTLAVLKDKLYILCRPYEKESCMLVLDEDLQLCGKRLYGEEEKIVDIGRPKLFVKDGKLYSIMRNHTASEEPMELILMRYDAETLAVEKTVILDDTQPKDGYYAEPYFDGETFCVVTYKTADTDNPDLVLLRFDWNEIR